MLRLNSLEMKKNPWLGFLQTGEGMLLQFQRRLVA